MALATLKVTKISSLKIYHTPPHLYPETTRYILRVKSQKSPGPQKQEECATVRHKGSD